MLSAPGCIIMTKHPVFGPVCTDPAEKSALFANASTYQKSVSGTMENCIAREIVSPYKGN